MKNPQIYSIVLLLLISCTGPTANVVESVVQDPENTNLLFVEPSTVQKERQEFNEKLKLIGKTSNTRALYEEYIDSIGANGILDGIDEVYDRCHGQAHDLGKIIYAKLKDISTSLRVCSDRCYTGCMHGVLMGAFSSAKGDDEGHIDLEKLEPLLNDICFNNEEMNTSYGPGECAHGIGHAVTFLNGYDIREALNACARFDDKKMEYYCSDGIYMEYLVEGNQPEGNTLFYPCDSFPYPAACMRTRVGQVGKKLDKVGKSLVQECEKLSGKVRLGCFHGIGIAHAKILALDKMGIKEICLTGSPDEQTACIEGAVEFMHKYYPNDIDKVCNELEDTNKETCLTAQKYGLYNLSKDLSLYFN